MDPDEFLREYEQTGRTGDVEQTLRLIHKDAVYWFSNGSSHHGKDAVEAAIRRNFKTTQEDTYHVSDVLWVARSNQVAVCIYRFEWSAIVRGAPAAGSGRGTSVLVRERDSWLVTHEHLSRGEYPSLRHED